MKFLQISILFLLLFISGCRLIKTGSKELSCPVPTVNCSPVLWEGLPLDTGRARASADGSYYLIEEVENLNTPANEYALAFGGDGLTAAFTMDEGKSSFLARARQSTPARFIIDKTPLRAIPDSYGSWSYHKDSSYFAISPYTGNITGAENEYGEELVPLSVMPGRSRLYSESNTAPHNPQPVNTGAIDDLVWESHPAIHPNGLVLFFASDRPGGFGGTDIWYMWKAGKSWLEPVNCGREVNTDCDDITPFVSRDGKKLLFASMGHATVGGYDLFESDMIYGADNMPKGFSKARNMRYPLNTKNDEIYPSSPASPDSIVYYASNQGEDGDFDIYVRHRKFIKDFKQGTDLARKDPEHETEIRLPENRMNTEFEIDGADTAVFMLRGKVVNETTRKPVPEARVTVKEMPHNTVAAETHSDEKGDYSVELKKGKDYEVTTQSEGLFYETQKVRMEKSDSSTEMEKAFALPELITLRITFIYDESEKPYSYVLDSNGIETTKTWQSELDKIAENIKLSMRNLEKVTLIGNTDTTASDSYNFRLGMQRARFIYDELTKRGIPGQIMEVRSEGERDRLPRRKNESYELYSRRLRRVTVEKAFKK